MAAGCEIETEPIGKVAVPRTLQSKKVRSTHIRPSGRPESLVVSLSS